MKIWNRSVYISITQIHLNVLATWGKELTHLKRPWCCKRLKAGGEGDDRGWDGWMGSPTRWTWVWVNFGSWWWTGRPGVLRSMGSQGRTRLSDWTEPNWKWLTLSFFPIFSWAVARNLYGEAATFIFSGMESLCTYWCEIYFLH